MIEHYVSKTKDRDCIAENLSNEDRYSLFRGLRYSELPVKPYDFVFVGGPKYKSPLDGGTTFDFDIIHVLRNSKSEVSALIDKRLLTVFVLQQLLGADKLKYSSISGLARVQPCTKSDLGTVATSISSRNFLGRLRIIREAQLSITQNP